MEDKSKDNLREAMELKDRTVSSRDDEDPSHQGVTEPAESDSMLGVSRSERTQEDGVEETTVSSIPDRSPRTTPRGQQQFTLWRRDLAK